jgi:hypothetical protein
LGVPARASSSRPNRDKLDAARTTLKGEGLDYRRAAFRR